MGAMRVRDNPASCSTSSTAAAPLAGAPRAAGAGGASSAAAGNTLPWAMSLEEAEHALEAGAEVDGYDASIEHCRILEACQAASEAEAQLMAAVASIKAAHGPALDLWTLGCELRARHRYLVTLRRSLGPKQPKAYLRSLRHAFLLVRGVDGDQDASTAVVDLGFRDTFHQAKSRPWYDSLLSAVPHDFVGRLESLTFIASVMAAAGRLLFRQLGLPLPPWREPRTVLSRWVGQDPEAFEDAQVPLLPAPEQGREWAPMLAPYHAPFRRAVDAAAAAAAASASTSHRGGGGAAAAANAGLGAAALLAGVGRDYDGTHGGAHVHGGAHAQGGPHGAGFAAPAPGPSHWSQLQLAAARRLATREPPAGAAVPMVLPAVAAPAAAAANGRAFGADGGGPAAAAGAADAPHRVIFGFPDQENRLRRCSAPARVDNGAAAAAAAAAAAFGAAGGAPMSPIPGSSGGAAHGGGLGDAVPAGEWFLELDGGEWGPQEDERPSPAQGQQQQQQHVAGSLHHHHHHQQQQQHYHTYTYSYQQQQQQQQQQATPRAAALSRSNSTGTLGCRALSQSLPSPGHAWLRTAWGPAAQPQQMQLPPSHHHHPQQQQRQEEEEGRQQGREVGEEEEGEGGRAEGEDLEAQRRGARQCGPQQQQQQQQQEEEEQATPPASQRPAGRGRAWQTPPALAAVVPPPRFMLAAATAAAAAAAAAAAGDAGGCDGAASEQQQQQEEGGGGRAAGAEQPAEGEQSRAAPARGDFKSLDQLLPKVRTVRLAG